MGDYMKYSIYVKNKMKKILKNDNPSMDDETLENEVDIQFKDMLLQAAYKQALDKLDDHDKLKKLELEPPMRFSDINPGVLESDGLEVPQIYLYHGIRFDEDHKILETILKEQEIKSANKTKCWYRSGGDNCNEGKYVSLIHYTGDKYDIEFKTFIEENVALIISPKLNPLKCKYLPYEEWEKIKKKLPMTKHRYSYAKGEYQVEDSIPFMYVVGLLYPYRYYCHIKGYTNTREDFKTVKRMLEFYDLSYLPIYDPTDNFEKINILDSDFSVFANRRPNLLK